MKRKKKGLYRSNKEAKVGEIIECPVCHTRFKKIQWAQAFCCGHCKDMFWNRQNPIPSNSGELKSQSSDNERRLNIAKDLAAVLLGRLNYDPFTAQINCCCSNGEVVNPYSNIAGIALSVADALIAEYEKGDATSTTPPPC